MNETMPVRCFATEDEMFEFYNSVVPYPNNRAELDKTVEQSREHADRCRDRAGDLLRHASVADVAGDLDLLRQAVGDDRLHDIGCSHSAYVGVVYAHLFPGKIGSLVVDSPQYPAAFASGPRWTAPFSCSNADLGAEVALCTDYPGPSPDRYTRPWGTRTSAPALVIGLTYDPVTYLPGVWCRAADGRFRRKR